ncbi:hypothetical protein NDU88_002251 [Pleurodeles waltl]|uniref:Uncharacterized protein n=1 Tax=Pleurodeles waltl TaxID=8319 RepID=A0AAV7TLA5_PLEWA|nr:hypothetical protein NDU88_002251 [Pleurodeles waltl]
MVENSYCSATIGDATVAHLLDPSMKPEEALLEGYLISKDLPKVQFDNSRCGRGQHGDRSGSSDPSSSIYPDSGAYPPFTGGRRRPFSCPGPVIIAAATHRTTLPFYTLGENHCAAGPTAGAAAWMDTFWSREPPPEARRCAVEPRLDW